MRPEAKCPTYPALKHPYRPSHTIPRLCDPHGTPRLLNLTGGLEQNKANSSRKPSRLIPEERSADDYIKGETRCTHAITTLIV